MVLVQFDAESQKTKLDIFGELAQRSFSSLSIKPQKATYREGDQQLIQLCIVDIDWQLLFKVVYDLSQFYLQLPGTDPGIFCMHFMPYL